MRRSGDQPHARLKPLVFGVLIFSSLPLACGSRPNGSTPGNKTDGCISTRHSDGDAMMKWTDQSRSRTNERAPLVRQPFGLRYLNPFGTAVVWAYSTLFHHPRPVFTELSVLSFSFSKRPFPFASPASSPFHRVLPQSSLPVHAQNRVYAYTTGFLQN